MTGKTFTTHSSFSDLIDRYDGFILDQFGVLHNGTCGLEGAPELVSELNRRGKKMIILSNSSSVSEAAKAKLPKLGLNPDHFLGAVTSGQEASQYISEHFQGKKALFLTWKTPKTPSPMKFIELCRFITITDKVDEADFFILHGVDVLRGPGNDGEAVEHSLGSYYSNESYEAIDPILKSCLERKLPMICANPDFIVVRPDGQIGNMPGKIAQRYEKLGGNCISFGKPNVPHFKACLKQLGLPKDKVAHVGDSLHHDIAGANDTGIASVLVTGGVHRIELGSPLNTLPPDRALESLFETHSQIPTHVVPMFRE